MFKEKFYLLILIVAFASFSSIFAQESGRIVGVVTDKSTGDVLVGANVYLDGTSMGASTDFDGMYMINKVPAGSYKIIARYVGYQVKETDITVSGGETLEHNVELVFQVIEGEEIEVTAQAEGQIQAINEQISAQTIKNVVAAEKIRELPDESAAAALSRLPGISLMHGDKIVIRGMQAKFNTVMINGVAIPSTDLNDRSTNLGFISSNLLSGIEVIKAITPDMDANSIGGVVNLRLREAPAEFHFDVFTQGNYNTQDGTTDNYKLWTSLSNRFFDGKLGVFLQGNANRSNGGQDVASVGYASIGDGAYGYAPYTMNSFTLTDQWNENENTGGSLILDYILPKGKIMLQNTYTHLHSNNTSFRNTYDLAGTVADYAVSRDNHQKDVILNALQTEYKFGDLKMELTLSHSYSQKYTTQRYGDVGQPMYFRNPSPHPFGNTPGGQPIDLSLERNNFDLDDALDIPIDYDDAMDAEITGWVVARDENFDQHQYNSSLDFTYPITFSESITSKFKFGGKFLRSTRENGIDGFFNGSYDTDNYTTTSNFFPWPGRQELSPNKPVKYSDLWDADYRNERGRYYLGGDYDFIYAYDRDLMDKYMTVNMAGWMPASHWVNSKRDDFDGAEIFSAGYLMADFNIGTKLTLLGGLRYEHYSSKYNANFLYVTHSVYGYGISPDTLNTSNIIDDNFFPNAQLRYKITDWADLRLAYTRSISRPDYRAIMPNIYFEPGSSGQAGNTKLKPATSTNYDAYLSFYNNEIGLFTVGGFYKKIDNIFFSTSIYYQNIGLYDVSFPSQDVWDALNLQHPDRSTSISSYINNPNPAYVKGLEFEWQTNFWYLPKPFNTMVLNVNYTRAWSEMDYRQIRNYSVTTPGRPPVTEYFTTDTLRTARLIHQGDHVINVAYGIDYKGFSGRLSFNMMGDVITSVGNRPEQDQFTGNIYKWDLTMKQNLPIKGVSIQFNAVNLFHNKILTYQKFRRLDSETINDNKQSVSYSPRVFELSLRYSY
ncbi:MAG: TonB-dependent receptor [Calditrichaceae bacterium]|nr:TonB-dependent receptor [Calditrichaceae bacterium]MBN2708973.1 TonB-dependent receptor [Calditrichaceae bacterium]RQV97505.1 MAG: TonB-dependent receptor [Calditrichota bacterium]